jgi:hypothetical protein
MAMSVQHDGLHYRQYTSLLQCLVVEKTGGILGQVQLLALDLLSEFPGRFSPRAGTMNVFIHT